MITKPSPSKPTHPLLVLQAYEPTHARAQLHMVYNAYGNVKKIQLPFLKVSMLMLKQRIILKR